MSTLPLIAVGEAWLHTHGYSEGYNFIIGVSPFKKAATACFSGLTVWPNQEIFGVLSRQVEHGHGSSPLRFPVCYHKIYLAQGKARSTKKKGPKSAIENPVKTTAVTNTALLFSSASSQTGGGNSQTTTSSRTQESVSWSFDCSVHCSLRCYYVNLAFFTTSVCNATRF
jgi:hypothetical protein